MEDHKLRVFCTVAETKSFSKTSEIVHLTQPAVSLQVQALEEIYETKLFDRSSNTVTLTPSGEILYKYAKEILALYASADKVMGEITSLVKGSISIGASSTIGNYFLPPVVTDFRKSHIKIKIHLLVGNTKRVIELLNSGNIDIGLVEGEVTRQKMVVEKLISDELLLVVPASHPWAKKKEVPINEITKEPFILREAGSGTRQIIEKFFAKHGISPNEMKISMVLGSTEAIKSAVENGIGISMLSRWAVRKESKYGTLNLLRIKEEKMLREFSLVVNRNTVSSHSVEEFLSYLKTYHYEKLLS
jgi:LysR family transcriptional regulator, transcriptional activator of the cysJI operon